MIPSKATRSAGALAPFCSFTASFLLLMASASAEQVIFGEVHYNPPTGQPEFIEIHNNTGTPFDIGTWYFSDGIEYTFPDFSGGDAHILKPYERILVSDVAEAALRAAYSIPAETRIFGPYTGALSNGGETVTLNNKNGVIMTQLTYDDGGKWPAAADGTGHTLTRINDNLERGEWRNWMSSAAPGGTPGRGPASDDDLPTTTTQITQTTSVWRYDQNEANVDRGTTWREPEFDDGAWPEGPGLFGKNSGDPFATPWTTGGRITYYMRQEFEFNDDFSSATIDIDAHIDDGFVVYLNGQEVTRFNMPAGEINYETPAVDSREWDELAEIARGTDISASLQTGVNVLAVEVHNQSAGSSDIAFGANMSITATEPPAGSLPDLVISEIHFGDDGRADWVELHTPEPSAIDVAGLSLASLTDLSDSTALTGSVPAGGYASFDVDFPVADNGNINLYLTRGSTVFDAQKFDRDLGEESFQSLPVGEEFYGGPGDTRDAPNNPTLRQTDIVINEIMFDAPSDQLSAEFIELYNRGASAVDLSNWRFTAGVSFDFPVATSIPANGYLVIAADAACLSAAYGALPVIGDWGGTLRNSGELIRLEDSNGNLVDEVDYKPAGDWPNLADGDGSSMELRHPDMDNYGASAWADSDESNKTTMQEFTYTHAFERASWQPISGAQELHTHLVGDAHVIIEDVSLAPATSPGNNLIVNPTVMSPDNLSSKGWVCQGTHWASFMDSGALNIISDGHGDNKGNLAQVDIGALSFDNIYTLTFKARWVSGKSRVIFQTLDHGFGTTFLLPIPENLGTPGAANSRLTGSSAPAITGVVHSPAVPKPNNPVKISAQVASAEALSSVKVFYRLDDDEDIKSSFAGADWQQATMVDDGSGLFSASLNQFNDNGDIVQFYVEAESASGGITRMPPFIETPPENNPLNSPPIVGPARPAMWIVDSRDMLDENGSGGSLLRERFIISRYDREALRQSSGHSPAYHYNFPKMSNHFFNATFISNESEVYYLAELRKSGSPFTRSSGNELAHGKWKLPGDRLFRGRRRSVFDASGTNEGSNTPRFWDDRIARYFLYQLGHPINEFEFVHWVVNTDNFKLRENHEPISNDML
ncbi:MAG: lamin tail domain-containing protein, partial [Verrucomicrobiales bacterium]